MTTQQQQTLAARTVTTTTIEGVKALLSQENYKTRLRELLGKRAGQFITSVINVASTLPETEPKSIIASAMVAAALDLPVDKNLGFAWIVPYRKGNTRIAQFQIGYKGYIQLALRSGQYAALNDFIVNREAFVSFDAVTGELKLDKAKLTGEGEIVGYGFYFKLLSGFEKTAYWPRERIIAHAKRYSRSFHDADSPWQTQFDTMALKTVIKLTLAKYGLLSVELRKALAYDQAVVKELGGEPCFEDAPETVRAQDLENELPNGKCDFHQQTQPSDTKNLDTTPTA